MPRLAGPYQLLLLGSDGGLRTVLKSLVSLRLVELGQDPTAVQFLDEGSAASRDPRAPLMVVFFGSRDHVADTPLIDDLIRQSATIAPLASSVTQVHVEIPLQLRHVNVLELGVNQRGVERVVNLVFETFRLLRRERKLFISYRRVDAQPLANRLYDSLDAHGFDVFIDTRSVPPAVDFQSELWHRMSDSDVVVLIDTPGFRQSRWTTEELAKANATNIQILHLLWPGQPEDESSSFSHFVRLTYTDFWSILPARGRFVRKRTLTRICDDAERLRARAIAARNRYLVDNFCQAARDCGMTPAVQPEQWILLDAGDKSLAVVPATGVPTSSHMNEIFDAVANSAAKDRDIWIIYDNRGVLDSWIAHLDWLDTHLPLRTIQMARVPDLLRDLTP